MKLKEILEQEHFAAITCASVGYTDSYGDHDYYDSNSYHAFKTEEELKIWVARQVQSSYKIDFKIIKVQPMKYEVKTSVSLA